jgi:hypothetical protein
MKNSTYLKITIILLITTAISCELDTNEDPRDKIAYTWNAEDNQVLKSPMATYHVDIEKHETDTTKILLYNFHHLGNFSVEATYNNRNINISNFKTKDNFTLNGTGTVASNFKSISWSYSVDIGDGDPDGYTANYTKIE